MLCIRELVMGPIEALKFFKAVNFFLQNLVLKQTNYKYRHLRIVKF